MIDQTANVKIKYSSEGASEFTSQWKETMKGFIGAEAIVHGAEKAFDLLKDTVVESVKAYDTYAVSMVRLQSALKGGAEGVEQFAVSQSKMTRNSKEELLAASNILATHKLNATEIKKLIPVIEDYAAKSGMGLVDTADAFARAIQYGTTKGLRPYGLELDKTGSQQKIFNELLKAGDGDAKGMAETMAAVGAGPLIQLKNQFNELYEVLGGKIAPILTELAQGAMWLLGGKDAAAAELKKADAITKELQELKKLSDEQRTIIETGKASKFQLYSKESVAQAQANLATIKDSIDDLLGRKKTGGEEEKSKLSLVSKEQIKKDKESWTKAWEEERKIQKDMADGVQKDLKDEEDKKTKTIEEYNNNLEEKQKRLNERLKREDQRRREAEQIMLRADEKVMSKTAAGRLKLLITEQQKELKAVKQAGLDTTKFEKDQAIERIAIIKWENEQKIAFGLDYTGNMLGMMSQLAEATSANAQLKKRLAEGEAVVSAGKGVLGVIENSGQFMEMGPIAGPILMGAEIAMIVALAGAQIAKIESAKMAYGGVVTGGTQGQDSVPAMLMPGEIVYNPAHPNPALANMIGNTTTSNSNVVNNGHTFNIMIPQNVDAKSIEKSVLSAIKKSQTMGKIQTIKGQLVVRN